LATARLVSPGATTVSASPLRRVSRRRFAARNPGPAPPRKARDDLAAARYSSRSAKWPLVLPIRHDHHGQGQQDGHHHHHDLNLKSAYLHVIADAVPSVAAIGALAGGWPFGRSWRDPVMGIAGAIVVAVWAKGLIADTSKVVLDREMDPSVVEEIREVIAERGAGSETVVADLHVWRVGKAIHSCALSLVTHEDKGTPTRVREWLSIHEEIVHSTIEIQLCSSA